MANTLKRTINAIAGGNSSDREQSDEGAESTSAVRRFGPLALVGVASLLRRRRSRAKRAAEKDRAESAERSRSGGRSWGRTLAVLAGIVGVTYALVRRRRSKDSGESTEESEPTESAADLAGDLASQQRTERSIEIAGEPDEGAGSVETPETTADADTEVPDHERGETSATEEVEEVEPSGESGPRDDPADAIDGTVAGEDIGTDSVGGAAPEEDPVVDEAADPGVEEIEDEDVEESDSADADAAEDESADESNEADDEADERGSA
jgi:hypothetical protein